MALIPYFFSLFYSLATRPSYWESGTANTKWHNATTLASTQPLTMNQKIIVEQPIPPPRKKRLIRANSLDDLVSKTKSDDCVPNGFRDVFGNVQSINRQKKSDPIYHEIEFSHESMTISSKKDGNSPVKPSRNGNLKIGNKKSDKFFGESLSDSLSDELFDPISEDNIMHVRRQDHTRDNIDDFVDANRPQLTLEPVATNQKMTELDKKAEFLMTMLKDDEAYYKGHTPVEEPIIVPTRKKSRHICDDTENLLKHIKHDHEDEHIYAEVKKLKRDEFTQTPAPKKPSRDLELYRKGLEAKTSNNDSESSPELPVRRKKSLNVEKGSSSLPTSKDDSKTTFKLLQSSISQTSLSELNDKRKNSSSTSELNKTLPRDRSDSPKVLQKSASSNSFLTDDLMRSLVNKVCSIDDYSIEDICQSSSQIDGSMVVSQNIQKLKTRKISNHRKISTSSEQSIPEVPETQKYQNINSTMSQLSPEYKPMEQLNKHNSVQNNNVNHNLHLDESDATIEIKEEKKDDERYQNTDSDKTNNIPKTEPVEITKLNDVVKGHKKIVPNPNSDDILHELYQNQQDIVFAFENFLEHELNNPVVRNEVRKPKYAEDVALEEGVRQAIERTELELAEERSTNSELVSSLALPKPIDLPKPTIKLDEVKEKTENKISDLESESLSSSESDASTIKLNDNKDNLDSGDEELEEIVNKNLLQVERLNLRRESIEDVDNWFTKHSDIPEQDPTQNCVHDEGKRVVAQMTAYDHNKLFPFGDIRSRHDSMNDEFFDAKPNSPKVSKHNSISED